MEGESKSNILDGKPAKPLQMEDIEKVIEQNEEEWKGMLESSSKESISPSDFIADKSKEFRFRHYPLILLLLKHSIPQCFALSNPNPQKEWDDKEEGLLYMYDKQCSGYLEDEINWKKTRMSVKLIVHNKEKGTYKLKNHKTDDGVPVMRRQTWQANGWRKNEYKLINRENFYKPEADGSFTVNQCQSLQDFPVIVHYFRKNETSPDIREKRHSFENTTALTMKRIEQQKRSASFDYLLPPFNQGIMGNPSLKNILSTHPHILHPVAPQYNSMDPPLKRVKMESMHDPPPPLLAGSYPNEPPAFVFEETHLFDGLDQLHSQPTTPTLLSNSLSSTQASPSTLSSATNTPLPSHAPLSTNVLGGRWNMNINCFSPDFGTTGENTKVLIIMESTVGEGLHYSVATQNGEIPSVNLSGNIIEFKMHSSQAGIIPIYVLLKDSQGRILSQSTASSFYFIPNESGKLDLSSHNLHSSDIGGEVLSRFKQKTKELDLSHNHLGNIDFLEGFNHLHTLILDNNQLSSHCRFPFLPSLRNLFIHCNFINDLEIFLDHLKLSCPNLQHLSLLGNSSCSAFSQPQQYYQYRMMVLSKLRKLTHLDSTTVTSDELNGAFGLSSSSPFSAVPPYSSLPSSTVNT